MRGIKTTLLAVGLAGCAGPKEPPIHRNPPDPGPDPIPAEVSDLAAKAGQVVTLTGKAENAKLGAVVLVGDSPVYVAGLESGWPDEFDAQQVKVTGTLVEKKLIPDPTVGPNGEISQGAFGSDWVLEGATWEKAAP